MQEKRLINTSRFTVAELNQLRRSLRTRTFVNYPDLKGRVLFTLTEAQMNGKHCPICESANVYKPEGSQYIRLCHDCSLQCWGDQYVAKPRDLPQGTPYETHYILIGSCEIDIVNPDVDVEELNGATVSVYNSVKEKALAALAEVTTDG